MHPDPSLLVAYLDGTLFHRDARDVDEHLATCRSCSDLLQAMQRVRADEQRSKGARLRMIGAAIGTLAIVAIAGSLWLRPKSTAPRETAAARADTTATPKADASSSNPPPVSSTAGASEREPVAPATPPVAPPSKESPRRETRRTANAKAPAAATKPAAKPTAAKQAVPRAAAVDAKASPSPLAAKIDGDIVIQGRRANRGIIWRTRDRTIEHSTDGGATWLTEYTADRTLRAGAFVDPNVVWLVGENGLVLRRTKNGWFAATAPGDVTLTSVRASSPSKASVTLADGRVFTTENGGVTWSPAERR